MSGYRPYDQYAGAHGVPRDLARRDFAGWLFGSLVVSLVPFAIVALIYRALFEDHGDRTFPTLPMLFGDGDLLLVVLSVTGATVVELVLHPTHLTQGRTIAGFAVSLVVALAAVALFTAVVYAALTKDQEPPDRSFITTLSIVLLTLVVLIQAMMLLSRPSEGPG